MARNTPSLALEILHYAAPITVWLSFLASSTAATCLLHKRSRAAGNATRRMSSIFLLLAIIACFIAQAIVYFAQSLIQRGFWAKQDSVVYILASVFAYGVLLVGLLEQSKLVWYPYAVAFAIALTLDIPITVLDILTAPRHDDFAFSRLAIQVSRTLILVALTVLQGWYLLEDRKQKPIHRDEAEPLLSNGNGNPTNGSAVKLGYATLPKQVDTSDDESLSDNDSDISDSDHHKEIKLQQRKRLAEKGSWFNYVKEFRIFIPMLWPSKNRFVQLCLVIIGMVILAQRVLTVMVPRQLGIITDQLTQDNGHGHMPWKAFGTWMILTALNSRAGISLIQSLAEIPVEQFTWKAITNASFQHIMHLSMAFHNEKNSGELIRAIHQGHSLRDLLDYACFQIGPTFIDLIIAFVYTYVLFDIYMSMILAVTGLLYIWAGAKVTTWNAKHRRQLNATWRKESKVQNEAINNWQTVSHFNRGTYECERYNKILDEVNASERQYYLSVYFGTAGQALIMLIGRLSAIFLAVYRVSQGAVPVGNLVTLTAYWASIEGPLNSLSWSMRRLTAMLTDAERLLQLFQQTPTVTDAPGAVDISVKEGHVEFQHVEFAYDARKPILKDVSFVAKPGQTIALCGETGGGKTTILKLLYRYYDVNAGSIRIDGQDIRGVTLDSLRNAFGMVPQDPALFNLSIMENLKYARLDATDEEVKEACKEAAIHSKIESFPDGYAATVGERGVKLSGGELQRVAIARAILRQPKIVLLDEATSMIDAETEATIQQAFKRLSAKRTTFIIAHRLSTIQHADLILVVQDGEIIQRGTHDQLFRDKEGKYVALWSKQLSKEVQEIGQTLREGDDEQAPVELDGDTEATDSVADDSKIDDASGETGGKDFKAP